MVDHHVDRPGVEAPQGVELTGTNRSEIFKLRYIASVFWHWKFFSVQLSDRDRLELRLAIAAGITFGSHATRVAREPYRFLAPMAAGSHPFPSRTRQLSPPAPMIVGPQGPSKVGRRQIIKRKSRPP